MVTFNLFDHVPHKEIQFKKQWVKWFFFPTTPWSTLCPFPSYDLALLNKQQVPSSINLTLKSVQLLPLTQKALFPFLTSVIPIYSILSCGLGAFPSPGLRQHSILISDTLYRNCLCIHTHQQTQYLKLKDWIKWVLKICFSSTWIKSKCCYMLFWEGKSGCWRGRGEIWAKWNNLCC